MHVMFLGADSDLLMEFDTRVCHGVIRHWSRFLQVALQSGMPMATQYGSPSGPTCDASMSSQETSSKRSARRATSRARVATRGNTSRSRQPWLGAHRTPTLVLVDAQRSYPRILHSVTKLAATANVDLCLLHRPPMTDIVHRAIRRRSTATATFEEVPRPSEPYAVAFAPALGLPEVPNHDFHLFAGAVNATPQPMTFPYRSHQLQPLVEPHDVQT